MNRRVAGLVGMTMLVAGLHWSTVGTTASAEQVAPNPLVVVFDLSGSMNDDDGTGTIKLQAAKDALNRLIDAQERTHSVRQMGIWTYPGGETVDGCAAGAWVPGAELKLHDSPTALSAAVSTMSADGGTPTGPAMLAVAEDLRNRRGQERATLVLVSDGLSNCGTPPCEVAQSLVDEGFDVTVNPVGFQIDSEGRTELECIAGVTRGTYVDANDRDQLEQVIKQYATPEVDLKVELVTPSVSPGVPAVVSATVTNLSAVTLRDVKLSLAPIGETSRRLFPQIVPPQLSLGNIPPGECPGLCTRVWSLPVGELVGEREVATLKLVASADSAVSASQELSVTVTREGTAGTWLADAVNSGSFVIVGDSYSSGEGAGAYLETPNGEVDPCHRSAATYIYTEYGMPGKDWILACSGAVTANLWGGSGQHGEFTQVTQLWRLDPKPDVIFLTIGGNNVEFKSLVTACVLTDCTEPIWESMWTKVTDRLLPALKAELPGLYRSVLAAAREGSAEKVPQVVVLPYPQVLGTRWQGGCGVFSRAEFQRAVDLVRRLDFVVQDAVDQVREEGYTSLHYAQGVLSLFPPGDAACAAHPHVNPASVADVVARAIHPAEYIAELMHPNALGHTDITEALKAWAKTEPAGSYPEASTPYAVDAVDPQSSGTIAMAESEPDPVPLGTGTTVTVTGTGFLAGSPVTVTLESLPRALGTAVADEAGEVKIEVAIPRDVRPGAHTLGLSGISEDGPRELNRPVIAAAPPPWWLLPVLIGSLGCLLGAIAVFLFGLGRRLSIFEPPGSAGSTPPTGDPGAAPAHQEQP